MKLVKVLGGFINAAHVVCAVKQDYNTKGLWDVYLGNGGSVQVEPKVLFDLPLYKINRQVFVNPDHVSSVALSVDRARMARDQKDYSDQAEYTGVEITMDTTKFRQSFFAEGSEEHDVWEWANILQVADFDY